MSARIPAGPPAAVPPGHVRGQRAAPPDTPDRTRPSGWPGAPRVFEGLVAAGLGLGSLAAVVLLLWTVSPHPDDGPAAALRIAADLWLLAHGAALLRTETLSGGPAPVAITPLLLTVIPGWSLVRAVRVCVISDGGSAPGTPSTAADGCRAALWVCAGYLTVAAGAVLYTAGGPLRSEPWSAALCPTLFALALTLLTAWWLCGPPVLGEAAQRLVETGAPRAAVAGLAALGAAGALLAAAALVTHAGAAQAAFGQLAGDWSGRLALLLLACALAPNAAVWAAAYGLGPGFALGGAVMSPLLAGGPLADQVPAAGPAPWLPTFPLLAAAVPGSGPADGYALAVAGTVPLAAVLAVAVFLGRTAVPVRADRDTATGWRETVLAAQLTAGLLGCVLGVLAWLSGGPVGTGELAELGPDPWLTGLAAAAWVAVLGTPAALLARRWRLRGAPPARVPRHRPMRPAAGVGWFRRLLPARRRRAGGPPSAWAPGSRHRRWSELKDVSGGLVPRLGPRPPTGPDRPTGSRPPAPESPPRIAPPD